MTTGHSKLLGDICDFLRKNGIYYVRTNSHGYGRKGIPDILACYRGKFVGIEAKVAPDTPKKWQERELAAIREAGGTALVIYDAKELGRVMLFAQADEVGFIEGMRFVAPERCVESYVEGGVTKHRRVALPFKSFFAKD